MKYCCYTNLLINATQEYIYVPACKVTLKFMYMQIAVLYHYKYKSENEQNI